MMTIPRLPERLACIIYRRRLEMEQEELKPELNILRASADELKQSRRFKTLLATVLEIGNALNSGTFRGAADGFQIEALLKVRALFGKTAERARKSGLIRRRWRCMCDGVFAAQGHTCDQPKVPRDGYTPPLPRQDHPPQRPEPDQLPRGDAPPRGRLKG